MVIKSAIAEEADELTIKVVCTKVQTKLFLITANATLLRPELGQTSPTEILGEKIGLKCKF